MKQKLILVTISLAIVFFVSFLIPQENSSFRPTKHATLAGAALNLVIADNDETRSQGLASLKNIPNGTGMFFVFNEPDYLGFWMKDMKFPIDMIWFDQDYKIVSIEENISPDTYPEVFTPQVLAQYVLEVPANFVSKHNVQIGDKISF